MTQYRKKPVTIEAVRFDGLNPTEIKDFVGKNCEVKIYDNEVTTPVARIVIHTLEGDMKVSKGDYVIKGVRGEFYPCKPDIFEQTYESVESQKELDDAAKEYAEPYHDKMAVVKAFKTGVEWQKEQYHFFNKAWAENMQAELDRNYENGKQAMKEQIMSKAVEYEVVDFSSSLDTNPHINVPLDNKKYRSGDKVYIIIVEEN